MAVSTLVAGGAGVLRQGWGLISKIYEVVGPTTVLEASASVIPGSLVTSFQLGQSSKAGSKIPVLTSGTVADFLQGTAIFLCGVRAARIFYEHVRQTYVPDNRGGATALQKPGVQEATKKGLPPQTTAPAALDPGWADAGDLDASAAHRVSKASLTASREKAVSSALASLATDAGDSNASAAHRVSKASLAASRVKAVSSALASLATVQIATQALLAGAMYNANDVGSLPCAELMNRILAWVAVGGMVGIAADVIRVCRTSSKTIGFVEKKVA